MSGITSVASIIDHTLLRPDATRADVLRLCDEAVELGFAAVCLNPVWVALAAERLAGAHPSVCTVVAFPLGASSAAQKADEAARAIEQGATELDMVINIGAVKSNDLGSVADEIAAVVGQSRGRGLVKVILETGLLTDDEKTSVCLAARAAGAGYVKTSTGFGHGGATIGDVALMRRVVGPSMGVKAAGGIRDAQTVVAMVEAGATRIGTSTGVAIVREWERRRAAPWDIRKA